MRILMIWDQAGVSCILAKYLRRNGHQVKVIKTKRDDELGFLEYYNETLMDCSPDEFDDFAITISANYDIIHCHSTPEIARIIKEIFPEKKVFIHYHGSDIRTNPVNKKCNDIVDGIFHATPDLKQYLPDGSIYIPTIIDTDLFFHQGRGGSGGTFRKEDINCKYSMTPFFYRSFDIFIDSKIICGEQIKEISKTGLECMALGLKVIDWKGITHEGLPENHKPNNVVDVLQTYYGHTK